MNDNQLIAKKILQKAENVAKRFEVLSEQNLELEIQIEDLKEVINSQKEIITKLENKSKILTITNSISSNNKSESKDAKKKINEFLREIDKCIALLNQ